jgi:hypothetical protein
MNIYFFAVQIPGYTAKELTNCSLNTCLENIAPLQLYVYILKYWQIYPTLHVLYIAVSLYSQTWCANVRKAPTHQVSLERLRLVARAPSDSALCTFGQ